MPITGPASYLPTTDEFVNHWAAANAALGVGNAIVLPGNIQQAALVTLRDNLAAARDNVTDTGVDDALARERRQALVVKLQAKLVEFNGRVRADLPGSPFARVLPVAFSVGDAEGTVRDALRQMSRLWLLVNSISPVPAGLTLPMVLLGGYDSTAFETDRTALREAFATMSVSDVTLGLAREDRNDLQDAIYDVLKAYRLKLPQAFPPGDAMIDSLPALTPAGGHTPNPVRATAVWDAPTTKAKITWGASSEADLAHYEVRGDPGDAYVSADETVLATVLPADAREFFSDFALGTPGVTAGFKVYVVLHTGNERGSDAVYVTRPV